MEAFQLRALFRAEPCVCGGSHWMLRVVPTGHVLGPFAKRANVEMFIDTCVEMFLSYGPMVGPMMGVDLDTMEPAEALRAIVGEQDERVECPGGTRRTRTSVQGECIHGNLSGKCPEGD